MSLKGEAQNIPCFPRFVVMCCTWAFKWVTCTGPTWASYSYSFKHPKGQFIFWRKQKKWSIDRNHNLLLLYIQQQAERTVLQLTPSIFISEVLLLKHMFSGKAFFKSCLINLRIGVRLHHVLSKRIFYYPKRWCVQMTWSCCTSAVLIINKNAFVNVK